MAGGCIPSVLESSVFSVDDGCVMSGQVTSGVNISVTSKHRG